MGAVMGAVIVSVIGKGSGRMGYVTMGGVMVTRLLGQQGGERSREKPREAAQGPRVGVKG